MSRSEDFWVFGYGSLMWDPGFPWLEQRPALLRGWHRALCIYSVVWRGTPERPGLVLGLDRGGSCRGIAYRVAGALAEEVLQTLDARERVTEVYQRRSLRILLDSEGRCSGPSSGVTVGVPVADPPADPVAFTPTMTPAVTYVADRTHPQYAGRMPLEEAARIIREGRGRGGPNIAYLENTLRHLEAFGLARGPLHRLGRLLREGEMREAAGGAGERAKE